MITKLTRKPSRVRLSQKVQKKRISCGDILECCQSVMEHVEHRTPVDPAEIKKLKKYIKLFNSKLLES